MESSLRQPVSRVPRLHTLTNERIPICPFAARQRDKLGQRSAGLALRRYLTFGHSASDRSARVPGCPGPDLFTALSALGVPRRLPRHRARHRARMWSSDETVISTPPPLHALIAGIYRRLSTKHIMASIPLFTCLLWPQVNRSQVLLMSWCSVPSVRCSASASRPQHWSYRPPVARL